MRLTCCPEPNPVGSQHSYSIDAFKHTPNHFLKLVWYSKGKKNYEITAWFWNQSMLHVDCYFFLHLTVLWDAWYCLCWCTFNLFKYFLLFLLPNCSLSILTIIFPIKRSLWKYFFFLCSYCFLCVVWLTLGSLLFGLAWIVELLSC